MYSQGLGVDQDKAEAVKWYKLAAEQGYTKAQSNLGAIYEHPQTLASSSWKHHEVVKRT
jgi:TPR repeat protein